MRKLVSVLLLLSVFTSCKTYEQSGGLRWNTAFEDEVLRLPVDVFATRLSDDSALLVVKFIGTERNRNAKWPDSLRFNFHVYVDTSRNESFAYRDSISIALPSV